MREKAFSAAEGSECPLAIFLSEDISWRLVMNVHGNESDGMQGEGKPARLRPVPRAGTLPRGPSSKVADTPEEEASVETSVRKPHQELGRRIRPANPKVPFNEPLQTPPADGAAKPMLPPGRHGIHRGFRRFFTSRRKGSHRIVTFIILPAAVLIAFGIIFVVLKYF
jgi:hypothetical protein